MEFKISSTHNFSNGDPFPCPRTFFLKEYGLLTHFITYTDLTYESYDFLLKNGTLLGSSRSFRKKNKSRDEDLIQDKVFALNSSDNDSCREFYWYKDTVCDIKYNFSTKLYSLSIWYPLDSTNPFQELVESWIDKKNDSRIGVLVQDYQFPYFEKISITVPPVDVELNYGSTFLPVSNKIIQSIRDKKSGLITLNGIPGSGKSTYIKYLTTQTDRELLYIPANMIASLDSAQILQLLLDHRNAILIMEDAEQAILKREEHGTDSIVSTLLNLADGILGSIMNFTLIITYNTERERIDPALTRKGRLLADHKFSALSVEDAQKLVNHLGYNLVVKEPMTLAEIYNFSEPNFVSKPQDTTIGFK